MYELYSPVKGIDNLGNIKLGRTYRITKIDGSIEYRLLRKSRDYYTLKKQISANPQLFVSIRE
jgi:hypothetical protein